MTTVETIDYSYHENRLDRGLEARQARITTERWVAFDAEGNVARVRLRAVDAFGEPYQDILIDTDGERVTFHNWLGSGRACTQRGGRTLATYQLPFVDADSLSEGDWREMEAVGEGSRLFERSRQLDSAMLTATRTELLLDEESGQLLAERAYGTLRDGTEVFCESWTNTPVEWLDEAPLGTWDISRHAGPVFGPGGSCGAGPIDRLT